MKASMDRIDTGDRLRTANSAQVAALADSMARVGLLSPITVYAAEVVRGIAVPGFKLIAGLHRLEAARSLGWSEIDVHVVTLDDLHRQLAECDENLCGTKLTPSERALFTRRRKDIYVALHPETRQGVAGAQAKHGHASDNLSFAADTAARTGVDRRTVERDATRGERIPEDVLQQVRGTEMDKGIVLDALAKAADPAAELARMREPAPPKPQPERDSAEDAWREQVLALWNKAPKRWRARLLKEMA